MATSSITKNFVISGKEQVEMFVNAIAFSKKMKAEDLPRFEDVLEEFRDRFNDEWLKNRGI